MDMSIAPLTNEIHGMVVEFEFKVKGICPMAGAYTGTCHITYLPKFKFVNVELLAQKQLEARLIAENLVVAIFMDMVSVVGIEVPIKIELNVSSESHGPIYIRYNPSCLNWRRIRKYL